MLVNIEDFARFNLALPNEINRVKLERAIFEAENNDLSLYFNDIFLTDLKANYTATKYKTILDGTTWTRSTYSIKFEGLKIAICYFAYARLLNSMTITVVQDAVVNKASDYSEKADKKEVSAEVANCEQMGMFFVNKVKEYLSYNTTTYPIYFSQFKKSTRYNVIG